MTTALALAAAVGAALVIHLWWPRDPLRRLAMVPTMEWPAWLRPKASALPARTRGIAAAGAALTSTLVLDVPLPASLALGIALCGVLFWVLGRLETGGAAARRAELVSELPTGLDLLAACVASGMPLRSATSAVASAVGGRLGEQLSSVVSRTAAGFGDGDAWGSLRGDEVLGSVARDLARAADAGTATGALLARHAEAARSAAHAAALAREGRGRTDDHPGLRLLPTGVLPARRRTGDRRRVGVAAPLICPQARDGARTFHRFSDR